MRLKRVAEIVENGINETLSYYDLPLEHWRCIKTNNPLQRLMREIRRRTRVVGAFPDGQSALTPARLWHVAATRVGSKALSANGPTGLSRGYRMTGQTGGDMRVDRESVREVLNC